MPEEQTIAERQLAVMERIEQLLIQLWEEQAAMAATLRILVGGFQHGQ